METLLAFVAPDFGQELIVAAVIFLWPLKKRMGGKRRLLLLAAVGWLLSAWFYYADRWEWYSWLEHQTAVSPFLWFSVFLLGFPLLVTFLLFWCVGDISVWDALYGTCMAYVVQHAGFCISTFALEGTRNEWPHDLFVWLLYLAVAAPTAYAGARYLSGSEGMYHASRARVAVTGGMVLLLMLVLNWLVRNYAQSVSQLFFTVCVIYDVFCCFFILLTQVQQKRELELRTAVAAEQRLRVQMREQYAMSRENIDIINRKSHDLKHQISLLRSLSSDGQGEELLDELEREVLIYDTTISTGNEALDTVLTEKGLICRENHITWTCMVDGKLLDFIKVVDLYTLFGNALDNAIEACKKLPDEKERIITVTAGRRFGVVTVEIENYFSEAPRWEAGQIRTGKADRANHGFGLRSMEFIVNKYGGSMEVFTQDRLFRLTFLFPRTV